MTDFVQVSTTTASAAEAEQIATALVEQHLAACVQIIPQIRSVYCWEGKIEHSDEQLCLIKTRRSLVPQVEAEVIRCHAYQCPEIITVPIEAVSPSYLQWLELQLPE